MFGKSLKVISLVCILVILSSQVAYAYDQLYYKGSYYTKYSDGTYTGKETAVVSVSAIYDKVTKRGMNRVRVWSRIPNVKAYYDSIKKPVYPSSCSASNIYVGTYSNTSDSYYNIYNWDPLASSTSSTLLSTITYDILSYFGIPSGTIQAIVNGFTSKISVSGTTTSKTLTFSGGTTATSIVDLPTTVSYSNADGYKNKTKSSASAKFWYDLGTPSTFYATGKVKYLYSYYNYGYYSIYPVSGVAKKSFSIGS